MEATFNLPPEFEQSLERMVLKIVADTADKANQRRIPEYMDKGGVTKYLSVSRNTLDQWIKDYGIPYRKIGGKYVFKRSELDDWYKNLDKSQQD